MRILWDNEIDKYTPLYSSQKTNFPAVNVRHIHLSNSWRTMGVSDQYYTIDAGLGKTVAAKVAAIIGKISDYNHNFTSGITAKIQAEPTNEWSDPDLDEALVYDKNIMLKFFTGIARRFWRFYLDDDANADGYLNVPRLLLGNYLQVPITWEKSFTEVPIDTSSGVFSPSGQFFGDEGIILKEYSLDFTFLEDAEKREFEGVLDQLTLRKPAVFVLDENNLTALPPIYAMVMKREYPHIVGYVWKASITIRECQ